MIYHCCDKIRRNRVKGTTGLNGIDFLEVVDNPEDAPEDRQVILNVHFINDIEPGSITADNVSIKGGVRIKNVSIDHIWFNSTESPPSSPPGDERLMVVRVDKAGDYSTYSLNLIDSANENLPPDGYDPILSSIEFSFKVNCDSGFDCKESVACDTPYIASPEINYLAKDYNSFRQVMLDRIATLIPEWKERNPADLGITLVELLAYVGDYLSYTQDAIATEAYLGTARKRISIRRHARLIDYFMHDGCNARVWVQIQAAPGIEGFTISKQTGENCDKLLTKTSFDVSPVVDVSSKTFEKLATEAKIFELMHDVTIYHSHNEIAFHTWGDKSCCLPAGSTNASLAGDYSTLSEGDLLVFAEIRGAKTGKKEDADPQKRHVVRLTSVVLAEDPLFDEESSVSEPGTVTNITWHQEDALPFPLCISADTDSGYSNSISLVFGNIALADHGLSVDNVGLMPDTVPEANPALKISKSADRCENEGPVQLLPRYNPYIALQSAITQAAAFSGIENEDISASRLISREMSDVQPQVELYDGEHTWNPVRDLLNSFSTSREFVLETENNGRSYVRFGDNTFGSRPSEGEQFTANCRIGSGIDGNIGRDRLSVFVTGNGLITKDDQTIQKIWNPLPATGGVEPETIDHVRQHAPNSFRTQERAVIPEDYEELSLRCRNDIQRVKAKHRWTGSWHTVFIAADRLGGIEVDEEFESDFRNCLEKYRMAGYDLEVETPVFVSLQIEMEICLKEGYIPSNVKTALMDVFNGKISSSGNKGLFHPDRFSFGQTVYLSPFIAAASSVEGVMSVKCIRFQRLSETIDQSALDSGKIEMGGSEIARLDNDPNFPENGQFKTNTIVMTKVSVCNCCEGLSPKTPVEVYNRPGLNDIIYRTGKFPQFKASLLTKISGSSGELSSLTTREDHDFTIALLDSWAVVSDILTFYQERIANENYLRTAKERLSVLEMARMIGYELSPGLAASTYLSFTLEDTPGALSPSLSKLQSFEEQDTIPPIKINPGIKVQSIPGPDEKAQVFETTETIDARPEWNAIPAKTKVPSKIAEYTQEFYIEGIDENINTGDIVLLKVGSVNYARSVLKAEKFEEQDFTKVSIRPDPSLIPSIPDSDSFPDAKISDFDGVEQFNDGVASQILNSKWKAEELELLLETKSWKEKDLVKAREKYVQQQVEQNITIFRNHAFVFGYNAPKIVTYTRNVLNDPSAWAEWDLSEDPYKIFLDKNYEGIEPGSTIIVQNQGVPIENAPLFEVDSIESTTRNEYNVSGPSTLLTLPTGSNWYPECDSITGDDDLACIRDKIIHAGTEELNVTMETLDTDVSGSEIVLNGLYFGLKTGKKIMVTGKRSDLSNVIESETGNCKTCIY